MPRSCVLFAVLHFKFQTSTRRFILSEHRHPRHRHHHCQCCTGCTHGKDVLLVADGRVQDRQDPARQLNVFTTVNQVLDKGSAR